VIVTFKPMWLMM